MRHPSLFFAIPLLAATPAFPCSLMKPPPAARELVDRAEIIVRARADHEIENPSTDDPRPTSPTRVVFTTVIVLKGTFLGELDVPGHLESQDDPNESPFPYAFVRPGGRHGNCYALGYRQGAEYLLFLNGDQSKPGTLTPYWSPLSPTNEQLFGDTDRWLRWVTRELATAVRGADGRPSAVLVRRDPVIPGRAAAGR
jgi:hypothetical protein